jgi:hypothetical protein
MGRTELKPGEHGSISIKQTGPTTWRVRTRLKLFTEEIVQVSRNASREDEARLKVQAAVAELLTAGRGSDELKPDSKVGLACRQWITEMRVRSSWPRPRCGHRRSTSTSISSTDMRCRFWATGASTN